HLVCNLGNGTGFSVREVIESVRRVTGREIPVRVADRRPGDPAVLVAAADRARQTLGWTPKRPELDQIVADAWEFTLTHRA
ncbi:UDP-glucose 4-epimerase GalE, partial [Kitasatospora cineracea]